MASEKVVSIVNEVEKLTVLELAELVKEIEERFGVSAAAAVAVAAPAAAEAAQPLRRRQSSMLSLQKSAQRRLRSSRLFVSSQVSSLAEAKALVDGAPKPVKEGVSRMTPRLLRLSSKKQAQRLKLNKKVNSLTNRDTFVSLYFALLDGELYQVGATERRVRRLLCGAVLRLRAAGLRAGTLPSAAGRSALPSSAGHPYDLPRRAAAMRGGERYRLADIPALFEVVARMTQCGGEKPRACGGGVRNSLWAGGGLSGGGSLKRKNPAGRLPCGVGWDGTTVSGRMLFRTVFLRK